MASAQSLPANDAERCIRKSGVYYVKDAEVGKRVAEFNERGLPIKTADGLDFCAQHTFMLRDVRTVVESIIDKPRWGLVKVYSDILPSDTAFFFHNRTEPQIPTLLVQLWSPGSQMIYYKGSHLENVAAAESRKYGLLALPRAQVRQGDITETREHMPDGGLAIIDSRLGFTILQGFVINIGFATETEISFWAKMELPDLEVLRLKVDELRRNGLETNVTFTKTADGAKDADKIILPATH